MFVTANFVCTSCFCGLVRKEGVGLKVRGSECCVAVFSLAVYLSM